MDETPRTTHGASGDDDLRHLLRQAGPRPDLPKADLVRLGAAARRLWQLRTDQALDGPRPEPADATESERMRPWPPPGTATAGTGAARVSRRRSALRWVALAAVAAALAVAVGLGWWRTNPSPAQTTVVAQTLRSRGEVRLLAAGEADGVALTAGAAIPAGATLVTGPAPSGGGERPAAALRLAGGAEVRFDAGTRAVVAGAAELELAAGAIYVDSDGEGATGAAGAKGAGLAVGTPLGTVVDVGTRFLVRVTPADGDDAAAGVRVAVRQGSVELRAAGSVQRATAGEELLVAADGGMVRRPAAPSGEAWEWAQRAAAPFPLEGRTLHELLSWVTRETGWTVRWADPRLEVAARDVTLHGDAGDLTPDEAPFAVLPTAGLEGRLEDGTLVIRRAR